MLNYTNLNEMMHMLIPLICYPKRRMVVNWYVSLD